MNRTPDKFVDAVREAIRAEINKTIEEEIAVAQKRIEVLVRERSSAICGRVLERFSMERFGSTLRIEVDFKGTSE